ncbi:MAG: response regulator transcription factor [Lachnospiraceae bacterium]|nr:response regulator transcription factor [Lachnospiraceae bacterium]
MSKKILVVDDEKLIVKGIKFSLEAEGFLVDCAYDGEEAVNKVSQSHFDLILLDVMLPKLSGYEVCTRVREFSSVPIIMLTAKGDDMDKILGLEYGADDYITKPFNILEVKARIKAIFRRSESVPNEVMKPVSREIRFKGLRLVPDSRQVFVDNREIRLTVKEYDVLELLLTHPNKVYSRESLMNIVWGYDYLKDARTVDVHVRRLREKIEPDAGEPIYVQTKWGVGYYFSDHE